MSDDQPAFDPSRHCDAMAATLGLTITGEQRPAVLQFLAIAQRMSATVFRAPLDDASFEPAPVFHAGRHDDGGAA
ncbi:DUF4089 domain-containing protein [Bosea sp. ANAM02]|uniref:DUF4089 domain-containing protein n=1 Tax=Bosea sp. ANAM02 TaxID=2020412 RepID=UPI00140EBCA8|nr:DUF4089 domain-containing protein [Bosea sp. ANAM02]BCB20416.1 hypothetical protein OCUBac02_33100 [Bosea sp. ANAM02]